MNIRTSFLIVLTAALIAVGYAPASLAASRPYTVYSTLDRGDEQVFSVSGRIDSIDYTSNIVVIKSHGDLLTVRITPTTSVERNGETGSIADLRPGLHVRIKGSIREGEMTAESIVIR
jgi:hypothetical protein